MEGEILEVNEEAVTIDRNGHPTEIPSDMITPQSLDNLRTHAKSSSLTTELSSQSIDETKSECEARLENDPEIYARIKESPETFNIASNDACLYSARGVVYQSQKEYGKSIADLDRAIQLQPQWMELHMARAWSNLSAGNAGDALDDLRSAERLVETPEDLEDVFSTVVYLGHSLTEKFAEELERDLQDNSDDRILRTLLLVYYKKDSSEDSNKKLQDHRVWFIKNWPDFPPRMAIRTEMVIVTSEDGSHTTLLDLWESAVRENPEKLNVVFNAAASMALHKTDRSRELFRYGHNLEPENPMWLRQIESMKALR